MILALVLFPDNSGMGQGWIISPGTSFIGTGGNIVLKGDMVNNGSQSNANNTIIFAGAAQALGGTSPVLFNNLTVASGSTTTITTAGQTLNGILLSNGTLNAGGNITLLSTVTGTALVDGLGTGSVKGNITMQRYLTSAFGYRYISSPFQSATVSELSDDMDLLAAFPSFYRYDQSRVSSSWVSYVNPAGILNPLQGYIVNFGNTSFPVTADITGVVNNGSLTVNLFNNNNVYSKGFNLVGNPYPSAIDWNAPSGWTKTNIDNSVYYFNADASNQYAGMYSSYLNNISSDGLASGIIPSMQGFFVHVSNGVWPVAGTLALNNDVRVNDMSHSFAKSGQSTSPPPYIRITAGYSDDALSYDPLCVYFDLEATYNFDGQYDAYKLFNTDTKVTNFYSFANDASRLSINAMPLSDTGLCNVRLGLKTERNGNVIFSLKDIIGDFNYSNIFITDVSTGITQDLLYNKEYKVNLAAGDYQNRFFLNLSNTLTAIPDNDLTVDLLKVYMSHGIVMAEIILPSEGPGILTICNLLGQVILDQKIHESGHYEFESSVKDGIYIVSLMCPDKRISKKIFIRNW